MALVESDPPDLVVLDQVMPGMTGNDCFHIIRRRHPKLPVLLCTGHAMEAQTQALLQQERVEFLQKPYVRAQLARAVSSLLGDADAARR